MSSRSRLLGLSGIMALLVLLASLAYRGAQAVHAIAAVPGVPATAQQSVMAALAVAGYGALEEPVWAGAKPRWRAPGAYRVFFVARSREGAPDVFTGEAWVDRQGKVARLARVAQLTKTAAGDETTPVLAANWLAFATRVAGRYQSITCIPLIELQRQDVYAFGQPVEDVQLAWRLLADQGVVLGVTARQEVAGAEYTIDPQARRIEPAGADLQYLPITRGEQAWLPNLVSRVRELPFVGPEKIAFLENVFFTVADWVTRLSHRQAAPPVALKMETPPPTPTAVEEIPTTPTAEETATSEPAVAPTAEPTLEAVATAASEPTPEGRPLADGIVWRGSVKPDPKRPYADVELVQIDPALLQIKMVCGTVEPRPSTGLVGTGVIPTVDWPSLVAGFNGGFAAMHGQYGLMIDRRVYLPARDGVATLAVYEDGSLRMGTWGHDLVQTPDMVSFRQNCPPLIENGQITAETGKLTLWGLSVANEVYLYRSGLGITKDGRLIYVAGKPLSAYTLARALQMAGAWYAMQLDVDEFHVAFITYTVRLNPNGGAPAVAGRKLRGDMRGFDGLFLRPFQLDFFYLLRRPERLAHPVRMAPTPQAQAAVPVSMQDLPGRIAFASQRGGNWDIYLLEPGRPDSVGRLTDSPADDLYPAWSRDGRQLAFASRRDGNSEIYTLGLASGVIHRVTHQDSEEWAPTWSPDGSHLAYQSDRNGQSDIYVAAVDGSGETRLTPMEGNHEAPDWSPDGQQFVFDSDLDVTQLVHASINLYLMGADGSNPRRLLTGGESPRWSPDGKQVAFTTRRTGYWQVFLLNADGSGLRQLTRGTYDARYPSWSPDGRWLAYAGNGDGHWELYAIPVAGGQPLRLTAGSSNSTYPAWGP